MTDRPYTDEDLRVEAARQLSAHGPGPGPEQTCAAMLDARIESTNDSSGQTWSEALSAPELSTPAAAINALINGAADTSEWAVNLGADGLQPDGHTLQLGAKEAGDDDSEQPFVRMHFAFHPTATDAERDRFVMELSKVIARNL
ncbi:hypothetical protein AB0K88_31115 [Streptomyces werraensis]|uniref:hypothetical protein n=1 Tax=Streptomyces werraensis TaxID=68284 RepID=UPI003443207A